MSVFLGKPNQKVIDFIKSTHIQKDYTNGGKWIMSLYKDKAMTQLMDEKQTVICDFYTEENAPEMMWVNLDSFEEEFFEYISIDIETNKWNAWINQIKYPSYKFSRGVWVDEGYTKDAKYLTGGFDEYEGSQTCKTYYFKAEWSKV